VDDRLIPAQEYTLFWNLLRNVAWLAFAWASRGIYLVRSGRVETRSAFPREEEE
jgi:hypothetical protein